MSNFNMFSKVFGGTSPDEVMKDIQHLRQKGHWQTGEVPVWAKIYQCEHDVSCVTPGMLLFVYEWLFDYYCKKSEWQPIESMPKIGGKTLLLTVKRHGVLRVIVGSYDEEENAVYDASDQFMDIPYYMSDIIAWMPMPEPANDITKP